MAQTKKRSFLKTIFKSLLYILIVLILLLVGLYLSAEHIIKKAVTTYVPQITQTSVQLDNITLSPFKGHVALNGFAIGNPTGYAKPNAFVLKRIDVRFDPKSILSDKIVVYSVMIDGTEVDAEATLDKNQVRSNLTDLKNNIQKFVGKSTSQTTAAAQPATPTKETSKSKAVVIRDLQINNTGLSVGVMGKVIDLTLPNIQQKNIGERQKVSAADAVLTILDKLTIESLKATSTAVGDAVKQGLQSAKAELKTKAKEEATDLIGKMLNK